MWIEAVKIIALLVAALALTYALIGPWGEQ